MQTPKTTSGSIPFVLPGGSVARVRGAALRSAVTALYPTVRSLLNASGNASQAHRMNDSGRATGIGRDYQEFRARRVG